MSPAWPAWGAALRHEQDGVHGLRTHHVLILGSIQASRCSHWIGSVLLRGGRNGAPSVCIRGGGEPDGTKCSGAAKCSAARRRAVQQIPQRINGTGRDVSEVWVRRWTLQSLDESVGRRAD